MAKFQRALVYIPSRADGASARWCLDLAHLIAPEVTVVDTGEPGTSSGRCSPGGSCVAGALDVSRFLSGLVLRQRHDVLVTCRQEASFERKLLRLCPCPVWLGERQRRPRRFLVALAPDFTADGLAGEVLRTGLALAGLWDGELFVAHAWTAYGQSLLDHRMSPEEVAGYVEGCRREAAERVQEFLRDYRGQLDAARVELIHGQPQDALVTAADRHQIDTVVVGTAARRGVRGAVQGNTAERLLPRLHTHVVVVKSPEFVCPVRPRLPRAVALAPSPRLHGRP